MDLLDRFGLADKSRSKAGTLSFGQLKVLELAARALALRASFCCSSTNPAAGLPPRGGRSDERDHLRSQPRWNDGAAGRAQYGGW